MEKSDEDTNLGSNLKVQKLPEALENVIQSAPLLPRTILE
jgi:hypothetical protein